MIKIAIILAAFASAQTASLQKDTADAFLSENALNLKGWETACSDDVCRVSYSVLPGKSVSVPSSPVPVSAARRQSLEAELQDIETRLDADEITPNIRTVAAQVADMRRGLKIVLLLKRMAKTP